MDKYKVLYEDFKCEAKEFVNDFPPIEILINNPVFNHYPLDKIHNLLSLIALNRDLTTDELNKFKNWVSKYRALRKKDCSILFF